MNAISDEALLGIIASQPIPNCDTEQHPLPSLIDMFFHIREKNAAEIIDMLTMQLTSKIGRDVFALDFEVGCLRSRSRIKAAAAFQIVKKYAETARHQMCGRSLRKRLAQAHILSLGR